jgi:predicted phage baseplate assembly protein
MTSVICDLDQRQDKLRKASEEEAWALYGLSYVEASLDAPDDFSRATLLVYFLGRAPTGLKKEHVRLEGGRRVSGQEIEILALDSQPADDPGLDDRVVIKVERPGNDLSDYYLRFVALDDAGRQTNQPFPGFDPRYSRLTFNFTGDCPSDLDCKEAEICPPDTYDEPDLNYLAKDYASFRQLILDRLALTMPGWQERHVPDIGITLVELLAYVGDHLSYYQDAVATEAYLDTARQRISVRRHVRLIDYPMHEGSNARALLSLEEAQDSTLDPEQIYFITNHKDVLNLNSQIIAETELRDIPASRYEVFEPMLEARFDLRPGDFVSIEDFVAELCRPEPSPVSQYIWEQLPPALKDELARQPGDEPLPRDVRRALLAALNEILADTGLYSERRFPFDALSPEIQRLIRQNPYGEVRVRLNRLLLEYAYPTSIKASSKIHLYAAHNCIQFYTWGDEDCCLPKGATSATLIGQLAYEPVQLPSPLPPDVSPEQSSEKKKEASDGETDNDSEPEVEDAPILYLQSGDILIFEEVKGPKTGLEADADFTHRHAVRLTRAETALDPLYRQPVVEIEWAAEDALPFPLCISAIGNPPACMLIKDISVVRGNVLLVDHGRRVNEDLGTVPGEEVAGECTEPNQPTESLMIPSRFRPHLDKSPLVFSQLLSPDQPAIILLQQESRLALPWVNLTQIPGLPDGSEPLFTYQDLTDPTALADRWYWINNNQPNSGWQNFLRGLLSAETEKLLDEYDGSGILPVELSEKLRKNLYLLTEQWTAVRDLLTSQAENRRFVAEVDNEGRAHLRFGDGVLGKQPGAGTAFTATYRTGGGPAGNVGAETISHLVTRPNYTLSGFSLEPRNPLPAQGGTPPEPLEEVKLFAPHAFKTELQRAITAEDYAKLARQHPAVQNAVAILRWTGSWYEVLVAIDPYGQIEAEQPLLDEITGYLYPFRRMGHDLMVVSARTVPLDISLRVCVKPGYLPGHVKAALLNRFSNRVLPDGQLGYFHPDNLTFGQDVRLSRIVAAAQAISGVESVIVERFQRMFEPDESAIISGVLKLAPMEVVRLDNDPSQVENGKLELIMEGGR